MTTKLKGRVISTREQDLRASYKRNYAAIQSALELRDRVMSRVRFVVKTNDGLTFELERIGDEIKVINWCAPTPSMQSEPLSDEYINSPNAA